MKFTIGEQVIGNYSSYIVREVLRTGRKTADIYLIVEENGNKYILKDFGKILFDYDIDIEHFGKKRDGGLNFFHELKKKNSQYDFLVKFIDRINIKESTCLITEYIEGEILGVFIENNIDNNIKICLDAIALLAKSVKKWHSCGFAHGDPHIFNCIVVYENSEVKKIQLFDYAQLHHPELGHCKEMGCFSSNKKTRYEQDLCNKIKGVGPGFISDLKLIEDKLNIGSVLTSTFKNNYK